MNYIKEAENYLRNYNLLEKSIDNMNNRIGKLHDKICPSNTVQHLDITGVRGSRDGYAINHLLEYATLKGSKAETEDSLELIDKTLDDISREKGCEHFGRLLKMFYIEQANIWDIEAELHLSERSFYRHKEEALKKFAVAFMGVFALKAM